MAPFHPTLVSEKLVPTVNFYEDYFDFVPTVEKDGYVLMQSEENPQNFIAVFDSAHQCVAALNASVSGLILSIPVEDVQGKYDALYMEGLDIYKEFGQDIHGRKHFVVCDPNGVLVNVHEIPTGDAPRMAV